MPCASRPRRRAPAPILCYARTLRRHSSSRFRTRRPSATAQIDRINEISQLARTAWFSLLGYLVFVGITLLGVEDADFFVPSRQTQLPLVDVEIPTASFFWTAPILGAALYTYLHLFLIKLWDAHGAARPATPTPPTTGSSTTSC